MIHRVIHKKDYTVITNSSLKDGRLSLSSRGLLCLMLSHPDKWGFSFENLCEMSGSSKYEVRKDINELIEAGYIKRNQIKNSKGKFSYCSYDVFESGNPCVEIPHTEIRKTDSPCVEIPHTEIRKAENAVKPNNDKGLTANPCFDFRQTEFEHYINTNIVSTNTNKENVKHSLKSVLDDSVIVSSNPELRQAFEDFIAMRKSIKAPLTDRALRMAIKQTSEMANGDPEIMRKIVEQSIFYSWRGLFPIKGNNPAPTTKKAFGADDLMEWAREKDRERGKAQ